MDNRVYATQGSAKLEGIWRSAANTVAKIQLFGDRPRTLDRWDRALMAAGARTKAAMATVQP